MSPYEILGVSHDANFGTVKKAYHKLCLEYHPDRIADPAHREIGQEKFKEIQNAYEILIDASKRAELDRRLAQQSNPTPGSAMPSSFHSPKPTAQAQPISALQAARTFDWARSIYNEAWIRKDQGSLAHEIALGFYPTDFKSYPEVHRQDTFLTAARAKEIHDAYQEASKSLIEASRYFAAASNGFKNAAMSFEEAEIVMFKSQGYRLSWRFRQECGELQTISKDQVLEARKLSQNMSDNSDYTLRLAKEWLSEVSRLEKVSGDQKEQKYAAGE